MIMNATAKKECILYYSAVVTNRSWRDRGLPLLNPAVTKRTLRLAQAFQSKACRCFVVSPGIFPRIKGRWRVERPILERVAGVPVITLSQLSVRLLGYALTPFSAIVAAIKISRRRRIKAVVQYCYFPDAFLFSLWCKIAYGSKIILDLEDICVPRLSDWRHDSETRPGLMLWGYCLMKLSIKMATKVIILTKKFLAIVPDSKAMLISGCQIVRATVARHTGKVNVLLSGSIDYENGMQLLIDAIKGLRRRQDNFRLIVCGSGKIERLKKELCDCTNVETRFMGFLSNDEFEKLYQEVDLCLVLQNPGGRHGSYKSPSKGYEAICSGKSLAVSDIGDFGELPDEVCYHLRPYTSDRLSGLLSNLDLEEVMGKREQALKYAKAHYDVSVVNDFIMRTLKGC